MVAVTQIDQALKQLYNIDTSLCADHFLIESFPQISHKKVASSELEGALYIQTNNPDKKSGEATVQLGIYLSPKVRLELETFPHWSSPWKVEQLRAFSVACEEVSHFHYLIYNLDRSRPVSEFELELQGEIDRFLLMFFCESFGDKTASCKFDELFEQLFFNYRLATSLSEKQKQRYQDASVYAKRFFQKMKRNFAEKNKVSEALRQSRLFYQMDLAHKISFLLRTKF